MHYGVWLAVPYLSGFQKAPAIAVAMPQLARPKSATLSQSAFSMIDFLINPTNLKPMHFNANRSGQNAFFG